MFNFLFFLVCVDEVLVREIVVFYCLVFIEDYLEEVL